MISHCKKYLRNIWSSFNPTNLTNSEWINKCKMNFCFDFLLQFSKNKSSQNVRYNYFQNKLTPNQNKKTLFICFWLKTLFVVFTFFKKQLDLKPPCLKWVWCEFMRGLKFHNRKFPINSHCVNSVQIRTRKDSVFGPFSHSLSLIKFQLQQSHQIHILRRLHVS